MVYVVYMKRERERDCGGMESEKKKRLEITCNWSLSIQRKSFHFAGDTI